MWKKFKMPDVNICKNDRPERNYKHTDRQRKKTVGQKDRQTTKGREI